MARISSTLLLGWDRIWEVPDLWLMAMQTDDADADEIARLAAIREGNPLSPEASFARLLDLGEFSAAEELLTHAGFCRAAPVALRQRLEAEDLPRARRQAYLDAANRYLSLVSRAERMGMTLGESPQSEAMGSRRVAAEMLARLDQHLRQQEEPQIAEMERRLAERLAGDQEPRGEGVQEATSSLRLYEVAVRRALDSRDLTLAAALLEQQAGVFVTPETSSAPRLPVSAPLTLMLDWFLLRAPRPASLDRYLPAPDDLVARALIEALARIDRLDAGAWEISDVGAFVESLLSFLGVRELEPAHEVEGGFMMRLAGFETVGVPALSDAARPHGTPLWIPRQGNNPSPVPDDNLMLVFHPDRVPLQRVGQLRFDGATLLALVHLREGRAAGLARALAADLPLDRVIPWTPSTTDGSRDPLPDPNAMVGRDQEWSELCSGDGLSVLVGAPGSGRTSLLERYVRGWPPANVFRVPSKSVLVAGFAVPDGTTLMVVDDADIPDASAADSVERRCYELIAAATSPLRIVLTRRWRRSDAERAVINVSHLSFADCRRVVRQILDPLNVTFDNISSLDRVAFLCGGSPGLLMILLDELLARHSGRRSRQSVLLTLEEVGDVWRDPTFRGRALAGLDRAFAGHEHLRRTLAAIVIAGDRSSYSQPYVLSSADLREALELIEGAPPAAERLSADLASLSGMGLVEEAGSDNVRLPLSGLAELCADTVQKIIERA